MIVYGKNTIHFKTEFNPNDQKYYLKKYKDQQLTKEKNHIL